MSALDATSPEHARRPSLPGAGSLGAWLLAIRPKTLAAGVVPISVGTALAFGVGKGNALPALAAFLCTLLIQVGTNLTNDYYDFKKGADTEERVGPVRVTQRGLLAPGTVLAGGLACFATAFLLGIYLVVVGGWPIVVIGLLSLLCGYAYTGGPYPLGYHGLGDAFVFVFFGLIAVAGTFYVQALELSPVAVLAGIPVGALAMALLAVNNVRDMPTDARAGKRTLVVRFGTGFGRAEYVACVLAAFGTPVLLWALGWTNVRVLIALVALPLAAPPLRLLFTRTGPILNDALAGTARLLLAFGVLFSIGINLGVR